MAFTQKGVSLALPEVQFTDELPFVESPPLVPGLPQQPSGRGPVASPHEIYLNLRKIDQVLRDLTPFYGPRCPVAVFEVIDTVERPAARGNLSAIKHWVAKETGNRPMRLSMGTD